MYCELWGSRDTSPEGHQARQHRRWEVVSLITLNHRWEGDTVGPVGDAAAA